LVVVGVGSGLDIDELYTMATVPRNENVFLTRNFRSLTGVADKLYYAIRRGLYHTTCCIIVIIRTSHDHRLNGSSSPVLTGDTSSL